MTVIGRFVSDLTVLSKYISLVAPKMNVVPIAEAVSVFIVRIENRGFE